MTRPFNILGIQQIALGADDKKGLQHLWLEIFGLEKTGEFKSEKENVDEDIVSLGKGAHAIEIDLMFPMYAEKKPSVNKPPLNHIGLWVDNLEKAVEWLSSKGMRFTPGGIRKGASGYDVCFIHPKGNDEFPLSGQGVLIELVQAPAHIIEGLS